MCKCFLTHADLFNYTFYRFWFEISKPLTKNRHFNIIEKAASLFSGWRCSKYDNKLLASFREKFHLTQRTRKPVHDLLGLWENQTRKQLSPVTCRRCGYVHTVPDNTHTKRNEEQDTDVTLEACSSQRVFLFAIIAHWKAVQTPGIVPISGLQRDRIPGYGVFMRQKKAWCGFCICVEVS